MRPAPVRSEKSWGCLVAVGELLVVDWAPPAGQRPRAIVSFTFDCGSIANLDGLDLAGTRAGRTPSSYSLREAEQRLPDNVATRVRSAMSARDLHAPLYLAGGLTAPLSFVCCSRWPTQSSVADLLNMVGTPPGCGQPMDDFY